MRTVGYAASALFLLLVLFGLVVLLMSLSDIRRYLRLRKM